MKSLLVAITVLIFALSIAGQEQQSVKVADFYRMVIRGLKEIERGPYRYTHKTEGSKTITIEVDAKRSIRVKNSDLRTGVISECIVINERIFHRSGDYPWISQTKDEFAKAQVALSAEMKQARANKDTKAFERAKAATLANPAIFQALWRPTSNAVAAAAESPVSSKSIAFIGNRPHKNKEARFYKLLWSTTRPSMVARAEIAYAFDQETGALLSAQTRSEAVYAAETKTFFITDEWEPDPSIVITAPAIVPAKE